MSDIIRNPLRQALHDLLYITEQQTARIQELEQTLASQTKPAPVLLTDDEIAGMYIQGGQFWLGKIDIARAIEVAVLKKNGWGE